MNYSHQLPLKNLEMNFEQKMLTKCQVFSQSIAFKGNTRVLKAFQKLVSIFFREKVSLGGNWPIQFVFILNDNIITLCDNEKVM